METMERADDSGRGRGDKAMGRGDDAALADADLMREAVGLLYGVPVTDNMSASFGINRRTVQRWFNGQNAIPAHVWEQLVTEVRARQRALARLEELLVRRADDQRRAFEEE
jgi:hypothetical protein